VKLNFLNLCTLPKFKKRKAKRGPHTRQNEATENMVSALQRETSTGENELRAPGLCTSSRVHMQGSSLGAITGWHSTQASPHLQKTITSYEIPIRNANSRILQICKSYIRVFYVYISQIFCKTRGHHTQTYSQRNVAVPSFIFCDEILLKKLFVCNRKVYTFCYH